MDEPMPGEPGPEDFERMLELADLSTPFAIRVAMTIGFVERLAERPTQIDDMAAELGIDARSIRSITAILVARGLMDRRSDGSVALSRTGRALLHPRARRAFDLSSAEAHIDATWRELLHTITTSEPSYARVHGQPFWEHLAADEDLAVSFDSYLADHAVWAFEVARLPIWPTSGTVVDVGGGDGAALVAILDANPGLRGQLVEVDTVAPRATQRFEAANLADRATVTTGSFFEPLPAGHEVYLLAHVLHDWPDDEARAILQRVADAGAPEVVVVERVVDDDAPTFYDGWSDLRMRLLFGGKERTADDWSRLAGSVGFDVRSVSSWNAYGGAVIVLGR